MSDIRVTRGEGRLELFLATQRAKVADRLIPRNLRDGRIVDIGCGSYPFFLSRVDFSEKVGLDKVSWDSPASLAQSGIQLIGHDLHSSDPLPLETESCDVVSMLAVIEHIEPALVPSLLREVRRVLRLRGLFVMTTPAPWTDRLLRIMADLQLVSRCEIEDHKDVLSLARIMTLLLDAGFKRENIRSGHFEIFMNRWVAARREGDEP